MFPFTRVEMFTDDSVDNKKRRRFCLRECHVANYFSTLKSL